MKVIHIFDLDDTLLVTPTFASMVGTGHEDLDVFLEHVQKTLHTFGGKEVGFEVKGDFISVLDATGAPMAPEAVKDMQERMHADLITPEAFKKFHGIKRSSLKDVLESLGERDGRVIVSRVRGFHADPGTIGKVPNESVTEVYRDAPNKMIVTGRDITLKGHIERTLQDLGLELPNHGLYCYEQVGHKNIVQFKVQCILEAIAQHGWEEVHFHEDREDWLEAAALAVAERYPHVAFIRHHITDVHVARRF